MRLACCVNLASIAASTSVYSEVGSLYKYSWLAHPQTGKSILTLIGYLKFAQLSFTSQLFQYSLAMSAEILVVCWRRDKEARQAILCYDVCTALVADLLAETYNFLLLANV